MNRDHRLSTQVLSWPKSRQQLQLLYTKNVMHTTYFRSLVGTRQVLCEL